MGYHVDHSDFIQPQRGTFDPIGPGDGPIATWIWRSLPEPVLAALSARGQEWEMTRYREYQAWLADTAIGETFGRAAAFLRLASDGSFSPS